MAMMRESAGSRWEALQAKAHLPEARAIIRREIARGVIRVVPAPGGWIRIIPMNGDSPIEDLEPSGLAVPGLDEGSRIEPVLRIERGTR